MRGIKNKAWVIGAFIVFSLGIAAPAFSQCTWGGTPSVSPPSATPLRAHKDLLRSPGRIAADGLGHVYITDPPSGRVFVRDAYGRLDSVKQGLAGPLGIAVDASGYIYVGEEKTGSVAVFDTRWNFVRKLGNGDGEFVLPNHIAIDPLTGNVYVVDSGANEVKVFPLGGGPGSSFGGTGSSAGQFNFPTGIYVSPAGEVFVADQNNDRVQVFDGQGNFLRCFEKKGGMGMGGGSPKFGRIQGITGDAQGILYIADTFHGYVQVFDAWGTPISTISSFGDGPGQLNLMIW